MVYFGLQSVLSEGGEGHDPGNHIWLDCDITVRKFTNVDGFYRVYIVN